MSSISAKDREILAAAWHCFETQPKVDYAKLAEMQGYKNAQTAAVMFNKAKRDFLAGAGTTAGASPGEGKGTPKGTPKGKVPGKGKKRVIDDDDDEEGLDGEKKAKKVKGGEEKEVVVKDEAAEDEEILSD